MTWVFSLFSVSFVKKEYSYYGVDLFKNNISPKPVMTVLVETRNESISWEL